MPFAIVPLSFIISHITAEEPHLANFEISTEASVWPALTKTPPFFATIGNTCPGDTKFLGSTFLFIAFLIVMYLSWAEIPVVTPDFASIETVNAVWLLEILFGDIKDKFNLSACFWQRVKQIKPLPYLAIKFIDRGEAFAAGIIKSPSFSLFSSSTKTNIFPFLASLIKSVIFEYFIDFIL